MLEIESKRCNPSIQQESYGDVKAIAFSFVKKPPIYQQIFILRKFSVNACIHMNDNVLSRF